MQQHYNEYVVRLGPALILVTRSSSRAAHSPALPYMLLLHGAAMGSKLDTFLRKQNAKLQAGETGIISVRTFQKDQLVSLNPVLL